MQNFNINWLIKDKATTVEDGKKLSELIEKGKFAVIPGSHYMFLENPQCS